MSRFFDTNILIYAQQDDPRARIAQELIAEGGTISVQVLNEFTNVLKKKLGRSWDEVEEALDDVESILSPVRPLTAVTHAFAVTIARGHRLGFYDALIVAAAVEAGCDELLTEDLQHGSVIAGITIHNPFRAVSPG
ncbi:MAG TPA: PIN domain-containing protein [Stellaceae bacterium]|nr:PIN domain-containing protein [Stellaceae bacterium]